MAIWCLVAKASPASDGRGLLGPPQKIQDASLGRGLQSFRGVEEMLLWEGATACPNPLSSMPRLASLRWVFFAQLKAVKGHCQICLASQFMFLSRW